MSMAGKSVSGQLPNSKTTLYTCLYPATSGILKRAVLTNVAVAARTVNLYLNGERLLPPNLSLGIGEAAEVDGVFCLSQGDIVEGDASATTSVDYVLSIVEKSA